MAQPPAPGVNVKADDATLRGAYANMMSVMHTPEEFVLDFVNVIPPQPLLISRIVTSPGHLKRMVAALSENLKRYEATHGSVAVAKQPDQEIGFKA